MSIFLHVWQSFRGNLILNVLKPLIVQNDNYFISQVVSLDDVIINLKNELQFFWRYLCNQQKLKIPWFVRMFMQQNFQMFFFNSSSKLGIVASQIEIKWIFGVIMNLQQLKLGIENFNCWKLSLWKTNLNVQCSMS